MLDAFLYQKHLSQKRRLRRALLKIRSRQQISRQQVGLSYIGSFGVLKKIFLGTEVAGNTVRPPSDKNPKTRGWQFTMNNPTMTGQELLDQVSKDPRVTYLVFQREQGTCVHFQGYVHFFNPLGMKGVKRVLGCDWVHLEMARGSPRSNTEYCTKKDATYREGPWTFGTEPAPGKRNDLDNFMSAVREGTIKNFDEAVTEMPGIAARYTRFVDRVVAIGKRRTQPTEVEVLWGDAGQGKSRRAWEMYPDAYPKPDGKWFDGYKGEDVVIWDDFDDAQLPLGLWLKLCDRYPLQVEVKGGYMPFVAKKIIFTSNISPDMWYPAANAAQRDAIKRRIVKVEEFKK